MYYPRFNCFSVGEYESPIIPSEGGEIVNKKKFSIFVSLLIGAILVIPVSSVFAYRHIKWAPVNAVCQMTGPPTYDKQFSVDNHEIVIGTAPFVWGWTPTGMVGDIQGSAICNLVWILYEDGQTSGISVHTIESATVIADGVAYTGSLTILIRIRRGDYITMDGTWKIIKGTGELEGIRGKGTWEPILETPTNPYDYAYSGYVKLKS